MLQVRENRGAATGNQGGKGFAGDERDLPSIQRARTVISIFSAQKNLGSKIENLAVTHSILQHR
jgi:hypothetical protein